MVVFPGSVSSQAFSSDVCASRQILIVIWCGPYPSIMHIMILGGCCLRWDGRAKLTVKEDLYYEFAFGVVS